MNDVEQARLYRRLAILVKVAAVGIIASTGAYGYLSGGAGLLPSLDGLEGYLSLNLDNGRHLEITLGPKFPVQARTTASPADHGTGTQGRDAVPTRDARAPSPAPGTLLVSAGHDQPGRGYAFCSVGEDTPNNAGGVQRASLTSATGSVVDGYGLTDATLLGSGGASSDYVLPLLSSIKAQGAVAGLRVAPLANAPETIGPLPNSVDAVSPGAGMFVMGVAHDAIDLLEVGRGSFTAELTPWYHTLNAGMRSEIIGGLTCDASAGATSVQGTADPRRLMTERNLYVSDGHSRLFEFTVAGHAPDRRVGHEVRLKDSDVVEIKASLAADLPAASASPAATGTNWNIERARYSSTRAVSVEIVVNGDVVATKSIVADGTRQSVAFSVPIAQSSWVALRLMGAGHSNPIYVLVDNKPVRASRTSIEWSQRALIQAFEYGRSTWSAADAPVAAAAFRYAYALYGGALRETASP